jgi:hypothetical protein
MAKTHSVGGLSRGLSREILVHIFLLRGEHLGGLGRSRGPGEFGRVWGSLGDLGDMGDLKLGDSLRETV